MPLSYIKDSKARSVEQLITQKNGDLRYISVVYAFINDQLRVIWKALSDTWTPKEIWRSKDLW